MRAETATASGQELAAAKAEVDRLQAELEEVHETVYGQISEAKQVCHVQIAV